MDRRDFLGAAAGMALTPNLLGGITETKEFDSFEHSSKANIYFQCLDEKSLLVMACNLKINKAGQRYILDICVEPTIEGGTAYFLREYIILRYVYEKMTSIHVSVPGHVGRFSAIASLNVSEGRLSFVCLKIDDWTPVQGWIGSVRDNPSEPFTDIG
jgi:hypothetical protein